MSWHKKWVSLEACIKQSPIALDENRKALRSQSASIRRSAKKRLVWAGFSSIEVDKITR